MTQPTPLSISDKTLIGEEPFTQFHLLHERGFTHIHFSHKWSTVERFTEEEFEQMQEALRKAGLEVLDVHGARPKPDPHAALDAEDETVRQAAIERFLHRARLTKRLGADAMVYHVPERNFDAASLERYVDSLKRVEDKVRDLGIIIALENHYKLDTDRYTLSKCFEIFDHEYIGFTFDPGHANISNNMDWLLQNCMERLSILHLNDNDGTRDWHWNPFQKEGTVDWEKVVKAIVRSPYRKPLQLEVYWRSDKHETRTAFLDAAAKSARKLQNLIDQYTRDTSNK